MMKQSAIALAVLGMAFSAFAQADFAALKDKAAGFEREKKYFDAAFAYEKAFNAADSMAKQSVQLRAKQIEMFFLAERYDKALSLCSNVFANAESGYSTSKTGLHKAIDALKRKRNYDLALALTDTGLICRNANPNDLLWLNRQKGYILTELKRVDEARAHFRALIEDGGDPVALYQDLAGTYRGHTEREGDAVVAREFLKNQNKFTEKQRIAFWNDFGYTGWNHLNYDLMKLATEELKKLGQPGVTKYGKRVDRSIEVFESIKTFPRDEKDIRFPKSIADFGVEMTNGTVYVAKEFGFNEKDSTEILQKALDSGASRIIVENTGKPWIISTISPRSNTEIIFQKGVTFLAERNWIKARKHDGAMFVLRNVKNVMIRGENDNDHEVVIGGFKDLIDRARNCRNYGASAFEINNCENISIKNMRVHNSSMDGICFGGLGLSNKETYIENVDLDSHFRQACSICAAHNVYFKNCKFRNTAGAEPLAGIDLEPAELNQANSGIYLFDCLFEGNMGGGLLFSTSSMQPITLYAKRCTFEPQRHGALMVFLRSGVYVGRGIKAPGKAVFEDCDFKGYSDLSPIRIDGVSLLDLDFINCRITDSGELLSRHGKPDAAAIKFWLNRDDKGIKPEAMGTITFKNVSVSGYTNAPVIQVSDFAGHVNVCNLKGKISHNGKKVNAADYIYDGPENSVEEIPNTLPSDLPALSSVPSKNPVAHSFNFRYNGAWWDPMPDYTYLFYAKSGARVEFVIRYANVAANQDIVIKAPSGKEHKLGQFKNGDNKVGFTCQETGWYSFHPASRHTIVSYSGADLNYYAGTGAQRKIQIDPPNGYTGYFEVPAKEEALLKVSSGRAEIRNAKGELVEIMEATGGRGSAYRKFKSDSGKAEVWSFHAPEYIEMKFFAPFTGLWADKPDAVPVKAKDVVRTAEIVVERVEKAKDDETVVTGVPLPEFLKAYPAVAKIVEREAKKALEWAKKGEYTKIYNERKAWLASMQAKGELNDQQKREVSDISRGIGVVEQLSKTEEFILKLTPAQLDRYAFCNVFAVLYGVYPDIAVGNDFIRCHFENADMPVKYPVVYWWIYKTDYENYINDRVSEMLLGFRDFTLTCDDDKKLDKLIPVLQKFVSASVPEDLKN